MNSFKQDEQLVKKSNFETMPRLFKYLLNYKGKIAGVFACMAVGTTVDLINPLLCERAIDRYIMKAQIPGRCLQGRLFSLKHFLSPSPPALLHML